MTPMKIVGLGGASNPHRSCMAALDVALAGALAEGAEIVRLDVHQLDLPMYRYGVTLPEVEPIIDAVRSAHGMIWCSPLYHGSVAGAFKNALDWLELLSDDKPPYLTNKVVGLIATSGGDQALHAVTTMSSIAHSLRAWTAPLTAPVLRADTAFDDSGAPRQQRLANLLAQVGRDVTRAAAALGPATLGPATLG